MTVKECYSSMGADYDAIMRRLMTEERITRFLRKFLDDQSYVSLCKAMEEQKVEEAFRAAHTLKGVCQNLALTRLGCSASELTEQLRNRQTYGADLEPLLEAVKAEYEKTRKAIEQLS